MATKKDSGTHRSAVYAVIQQHGPWIESREISQHVHLASGQVSAALRGLLQQQEVVRRPHPRKQRRWQYAVATAAGAEEHAERPARLVPGHIRNPASNAVPAYARKRDRKRTAPERDVAVINRSNGRSMVCPVRSEGVVLPALPASWATWRFAGGPLHGRVTDDMRPGRDTRRKRAHRAAEWICAAVGARPRQTAPIGRLLTAAMVQATDSAGAVIPCVYVYHPLGTLKLHVAGVAVPRVAFTRYPHGPWEIGCLFYAKIGPGGGLHYARNVPRGWAALADSIEHEYAGGRPENALFLAGNVTDSHLEEDTDV